MAKCSALLSTCSSGSRVRVYLDPLQNPSSKTLKKELHKHYLRVVGVLKSLMFWVILRNVSPLHFTPLGQSPLQ